MFSSNYNYDIIIVGGGISGLFTAFKLSKTGYKIILLESTNRLGGRIKTYQKNNEQFEAGAARIHNSHGKVLSLIEDLNLEEDLIKLPSEIDQILRNKKKQFPYDTKNKLNTKDLLNDAFLKSKDYDKELLINITFEEYLVLIYDYETAQFIKDSFGYDSEFIILNADAALSMFQSDFLKGEDNYYILKNGLESIINHLEKNLIQNGVKVKKNCIIQDINDEYNYILTKTNEKFYFKNLVCAIPQKSLLNINYFNDNYNQLLNSVEGIQLIRIYAKYPTKNLWFKNIKRTTTDNYLRHVIPIDPEKGLIMIVYADNNIAKSWMNYSKNKDDFLINVIHKQIKDVFDIEPPKPEFISIHNWTDGVHFWKSGSNMDELYGKIIKPNKSKEIYICGEAYSKKQGWIEGAIQSCYNVIEQLSLIKDNFTIQKNINCGQEKIEEKTEEKIEKKTETKIEEKIEEKKEEEKTEEKIEEKKEEEIETKIEEKIETKKEYTIQEVMKNDNWIVMEIDGQKRIYDLKKWVNYHPGGSIIFDGIKANNYYLTGKGKRPIDLFKSIDVHGVSDVLNVQLKIGSHLKNKHYPEYKGLLKVEVKKK